MIKSSMHNHTDLCDGKNTPEEMAIAAINAGFTDFGFSGHSKNTRYFVGWGMEDEIAYINEIRRLKDKYKDQINIYVGIENDYFGRTENRDKLDYIISSVHGFTNYDGSKYYAVDNGADELVRGIDSVYNGDSMSMIENYYDNLCRAVSLDKPDIIGHLDLPVKHNEGNLIFDENSNEYLRIAKGAIRYLADKSIFEVNTGGVFRGYRDMPYPQDELLYAILKEGGKVIISADAHSTEGINFMFTETEDMLRDVGFKEIYQYKNGKFVV